MKYRDINWQRQIDNKLSKVCNKNSIEKEHANFILSTFFSNLKKRIQKSDMPTIMIHGFGEFRPSTGKMRRRIEHLNEQLRDKKITKEQYKEKVKEVEPILERIKSERTKRSE